MSFPSTVGELIDDTKRLLMGTTRGQYNVLSGAISTTDTALTTADTAAPAIAPSTYLTIDDEIVYVRSVATGTNAVSVLRGMLGTTAAAHADQAAIEVGPRFPDPLIRAALRDEIRSWPKTVFAIDGVNLAVATNSFAVDLTGVPSGFYDVLQVLKKPVTTGVSARVQPDVYRTMWRAVGYRLERNLDTSEFASGSALFLNEGVAGGYTLRVVYSRPFDLSGFDTDATSLTTGVLLAESMIDIPKFGAAWRLLSGREVIRTALEAQGESRNAQEVPVGQTIRAAAQFESFRDKRLQEEAEKLVNLQRWRRTA